MKTILKMYVVFSIVNLFTLSAICKEIDDPNLPADPNLIDSIIWNENVEEIWDASWGGKEIRDILTPRISKICKIAGRKEVDERFLKDTSKWLEHVLKDKYIPANLWKRCIAVDSHILFGTEISTNEFMSKRLKRMNLTTESYIKEEGIDTGGILVRYSTQKYAFMVIDQATRFCVIVKKRGSDARVIANSIDEKKERFWIIMEDVFSEEVWKPDGTKANLIIVNENTNAAINDGSLRDSKAKGNEARLNKYFLHSNVKLTPGHVVRIVFKKRLKEKEVKARLYVPNSRFEEGTLFDSQDFDKHWEIR